MKASNAVSNYIRGMAAGALAALASLAGAPAAEAAPSPNLQLCPTVVPFKLRHSATGTLSGQFTIGSGGTYSTKWEAWHVDDYGAEDRVFCSPPSTFKYSWDFDYESEVNNYAAGSIAWRTDGFNFKTIDNTRCTVASAFTFGILPAVTSNKVCENAHQFRCPAPSEIQFVGGKVGSTTYTTYPSPWGGGIREALQTVTGTRGTVRAISGGTNRVRITYKCTYGINLASGIGRSSVSPRVNLAGEYEINSTKTGFAKVTAPTPSPTPTSATACPSQIRYTVNTTYLQPFNGTKFRTDLMTGTVTVPSGGSFTMGSYDDTANQGASQPNRPNEIIPQGSSTTKCIAESPYDTVNVTHRMAFPGDACRENGTRAFICSAMGNVDCPTLTLTASPAGARASAWTSGSSRTVSSSKAEVRAYGSTTYMTCTYNPLISAVSPTIQKR